MTPSEAADFLGAQARAILAAGIDVRVRLSVEPVSGPSRPKSSAERMREHRARDAERNGSVTKVTTDAQKPTTQMGSDLKQELKAGKRENPENPAESLDLSEPVHARGLAAGGGANGKCDAEKSSSHIVPGSRAGKKPKRGPLWNFVPDDWQPKDRHRTLAVDMLVDVDAEAAKFRAHEFATPRSDPDRAFDGWLRRSREFARGNGAAGPRSGASALVERSLRIIREEKEAKQNGVPAPRKGIFG